MPELKMRFALDAPALSAWNVLGAGFGDLAKWDSGMRDSRLDRVQPEVGATRTCTLAVGFGPFQPGDIDERLTVFDAEEMCFSYEVISGLPRFVREASNKWSIHPAAAQKCVVQFVMRLDLGRLLNRGWPLTQKMMQQTLKRWGGDLRHRVETGRPHPRNF